MKRFTYILIFFMVILGSLFIIPLFFKEEIKELLVHEINKNIDATTDLKDFNLSLFQDFPHFSAELKGLSVIGKNDFEGDTLAYISSFKATINLISVFDKNPIKIIAINIDKPKIYARILDNGKANYDIFNKNNHTSSPTPTTKEQNSNLTLSIQKVLLNDAHVIYDNPTENIFVEINHLNHKLAGNLSKERSFITTITHAGGVNMSYNKVPYLSHQDIDMSIDIDAVFDSALYKISNNQILINEVPLEMSGYVQLIEAGTDIHLDFHSTNKRFKPLLSLIPSIYKSAEFKSIQTDGELHIKGKVNGIYSKNTMPAYQAQVNVKKAFFKYPDLPSKVDRINIDVQVQNPTGQAKDLTIDANEFSFYLNRSFFNGKLLLKTLDTDPYIKSRINGELNLANLDKGLKIEGFKELYGKVELDLNVNGNLSAIETKSYDKFKALGYANFEDIKIDYNGMKTDIPQAQFNFSPKYVDIANMDVIYNQNDISANGKIENIFGYIMKQQTLRGKLNIQSKKIIVDELLGVAESGNRKNQSENHANEHSDIELPKDMDITVHALVDEVIYNDLTLEHINGDMHIGNQLVSLNNITAKTLNGDISLSGAFTKVDMLDATADMHFKLAHVSIKETMKHIGMFKKLAPILEKAIGEVNLDFNLKTALDQQLNIIYPTLFSNGFFQANQMAFADASTLQELGEKLKINAIKKAKLDTINAHFLIEKGNLIVKPFHFKHKNISGQLAGTTNLNQAIDYELQMNIPSDILGKNTEQLVNNLVGKVKGIGANYTIGKTVPIVALINGTLSKPQISLKLFKNNQSVQDVIQQQVQQITDTLKTEVNHQINKKLQEAQKKAHQLIDEAKAKTKILIDKAHVAAEKIKKETDKKAAKIIDKAKNENELIKTMAKKSAEQVKKTGYKEADKLIKEAEKQSESILNQAKEKGDALIRQAQKVTE